MQFPTFTLLALVAVAAALPSANIGARDLVKPVVPRQDQPKVDTAAMTDKDGNVLEFDSKKTYQAAKEAGL
jgi:hypothetical protein